jgi:hypothetical protein
MIPAAQRAEHRSAGRYRTTPRDAYTIADGILYLKLARLQTPADYSALVEYLARAELVAGK